MARRALRISKIASGPCGTVMFAVIGVAVMALCVWPTSTCAAVDAADAAALYQEGLTRYERQDYRGAQEHWERAAALYRQLGLEKDEADALNNLGIAATDRAQYDDAVRYLERALAIYRKLGLETDEATVLSNLAVIATDLAQYDKAREYCEQVLAISRRLGLQVHEAYTLLRLGVVAMDLDQLEEAREHFEQALPKFRRLGLEPQESGILINLGIVADKLTEYDKALEYYGQALRTFRKLGLENDEAKILHNLGLTATRLAQYDKALGYYEHALAIRRRLGLTKEEAGTLHNLGVVAMDLGRYDRALGYYEQALAGWRRLGLEKEEAGTLSNLGVACDDLGRYDRALSYHEQALAICRKLGLDHAARRSELNRALLLMSEGRLAEARDILERVPNPLCWGRYHLLAGEPREARSAFEEAQALAGETFSNLVASQIGLGLALEALGELREASATYGRAVEFIEESRARTPAAQRGQFLQAMDYGFRRLEAYEGLVRVMHRLHMDEDAFYWSEHTRARALVDALARTPYGTALGLPVELRHQEDYLINRIAALSEWLEENPAERAAVEEQLQRLKGEFEALISRLRREYPEYASMKYSEPLHADELALRPGEVLLAYEVTDPETIAFLVRGGKVERTFEINITRRELADLVGKYRQGFEGVQRPADLKAADVGLSQRLYDLLLKEPLAHIEQGDKVVIVPDEAVGLVPLEGLVASVPTSVRWKEGPHGPAPEGVSYVGDRHAFTYWQSATSLTTVRRLKKGVSGQRALIVADPVFDVADARVSGTAVAQIPATEAAGEFRLMREVRDSVSEAYGKHVFRRLECSQPLAERLEGLYGERLRALVGVDARESTLRREPLSDYAVVVFATHGILDGSVPWLRQPALVLSLVGNEEGEDGYLTMTEVMNLKLRAELVALMACQTGAGRVLSGEGVMGMGRAFQYAGARSVLASLWSVEDESTNLLAEAFLRAMADGQDKAAALSYARQQLRQGGYDHPFFWAPFILIGERETAGM